MRTYRTRKNNRVLKSRIYRTSGRCAGNVSKEFIEQEMEVRKFKEINDKSNDNVVHDFGFRKTDSFASKAFGASAQSKIFAFDTLSVGLAGNMIHRRQITGVSSPIVSIENGDTVRGKEIFQLQKYFVCSLAEGICENNATLMVYG